MKVEMRMYENEIEALFTTREGNPGARVILARGLP